MGVISLRDIIEKRYHEIKNNFIRASKKNHFVFSEDTFIDTYIKCCDLLETMNLNEKETLNYFWAAFVNNSKKTYRKTKYSIDKIEIAEEADNILDENYDDRRYNAVDIILDNVKKRFNNDEYTAWYLHFAENKSYEELAKLGYNFNFHNIFRNINNYVRNKLPKENEQFKNIITEIFKKK